MNPCKLLKELPKGLIMCSKKKSLAVELCDLSQAEKEIIACKAEQINKMTPIIVSWLKSHKNCYQLNLNSFITNLCNSYQQVSKLLRMLLKL